MKRKLERSKRQKETQSDEGNSGEQPGPSRVGTVEKRTHETDEGETGYVPIYDPIRAQMNTSNNGRNIPVYTQQMYPHPSMLQGALGASYPHYNAIAYNQQMAMQPTTSHHVGAQLREQHFNPTGVFAVGNRAHQTSRAQAENSDVTAYNQQAILQPTTFHQPWTQFRPGSADQLQRSTNDLRYTPMHVEHYVIEDSLVHQQTSSQVPHASQADPPSHKEPTARNKCHVALQKLREILKDFNIRKCHGRVTEDYNDLTEPSEEVFPKLLWLLKFYQGDLLKKLSQYQKDSAFKYDRKAASSGKELDYETFLRNIIETETKRISVIAQAGSGKTVMLKRLARDLAKHNDELLIFFMNFRDFTDLKEITPCDFLINGRLPDSDAKHSYEWILENQDKVMLIIDGLDQATWDIDENAASVGSYGRAKPSEIMSSLFKRRLFRDVKVVYSSREHAVASLDGELRPEMIVALTGLSPVDSEWLFKSFLQEDGEILWEKLRTQSHSLIPLLSTPAFLVFTAIVYVNKPEKPPRSMTEVLKNLLGIFMRSGHIVEKEIPVVMKGLKKMSFCGMRDGKVLFLIIDVQNSGLDPQKICDWIIRIPGLNQRNQFLLEGDYVLMFSHPTIQDFLAAQYIIEMDFKSFEFAAMQYFRNDKWSAVTRFVSGLLFNDEACCYMVSDVESKRNTFKNMLVAKGKKSFLSSLKLLSVTAESYCEVFIRDLVHDIRLRSRMLNDSDAYTLASVMRHLVHLNELSLQFCNLRPEILQILWESIKNIDLKISKLDLSYNNFDATHFSVIGNYAKKCSVTELRLKNCNVTHIGLRNLLSACKETKISKLDISKNTFNDEGYETLGKIVKTCAVDELRLEGCDLGDGNLKNFLLLTSEQANISKLDISKNKLEKVGYATLGQIVKRCAVDELWLKDCNLNDEKLKSLLLESGGAKISKLDISNNSDMEDVGYATLGEIVRTRSVRQLRLENCDLNDEKLRKFLPETNGAKIFKLVISRNKLEDKGFATLGKIVKTCTVDELSLEGCELSDGKLKNLLSEMDGAKILKLDISHNKLQRIGFARLGEIVKACKVEELKLRNCALDVVKLVNLMSKTEETMISKLDVSKNALNEHTAAVLGDMVNRCSVEELTMHSCELNDDSLNTLLSIASGAKLSKVEESGNFLSEVVIQRIREIISVKKLHDIDKKFYKKLSLAETKDRKIGSKGGEIILRGCKLSLPDGAYQGERWIKISVRSSFTDAPKGYIVASPELNCDSTFTGFATITLPLHAIPDDDHQVRIISKQHDSSWKIIDVQLSLTDREVTFQVSRFTRVKAIINEWSKIYLCHYVFFRCSTSELCGLTCIDDDGLVSGCIDTIKGEGFQLHSVGDQVALCRNQQVSYQYRCIVPERSRPQPCTEVVTENDVVLVKQNVFSLLPRPDQHICVECLRTSSEETNTRRMVFTIEAAGMGQIFGGEQGQITCEPLRDLEITKSTEEFYESRHAAEDVYHVISDRAKGNVLIINNGFERQEGERVGSETDVGKLEQLWVGLGFSVEIRRNLTAEEMRRECREFATTRDISMLILIIMSHGDKENGREVICGNDGNTVPSDDIISYYTSSNCPDLVGIPKVFIFQACRGRLCDAPKRDAVGEIEPRRDGHPETVDMLIVYPSQSGYVSYRNPIFGTRLISSIVYVFKRNAHNQHILELLTEVNNEVSPPEGRSFEVQCSNQLNSLRKKLFLFPGWP